MAKKVVDTEKLEKRWFEVVVNWGGELKQISVEGTSVVEETDETLLIMVGEDTVAMFKGWLGVSERPFERVE